MCLGADWTVSSQLTKLCAAEIALQPHNITDDPKCLIVGAVLFWAWISLVVPRDERTEKFTHLTIASCSIAYLTTPCYFLHWPTFFSYVLDWSLGLQWVPTMLGQKVDLSETTFFVKSSHLFCISADVLHPSDHAIWWRTRFSHVVAFPDKPNWRLFSR